MSLGGSRGLQLNHAFLTRVQKIKQGNLAKSFKIKANLVVFLQNSCWFDILF